MHQYQIIFNKHKNYQFVENIQIKRIFNLKLMIDNIR